MGTTQVRTYRHKCDFCKNVVVLSETKSPPAPLKKVYSHYTGGYGDMEPRTDDRVICEQCWEKEKDKPKRRYYHKWELDPIHPYYRRNK